MNVWRKIMGNSVEKRTIAQFVHDAVEIEAAIYTLDEAEKECERFKAERLEKSKDQLEMYELVKSGCDDYAEWFKKPSYSDNSDKYPPKPKQPIKRKIFGVAFFICLIIAVFLFIPGCYVLSIVFGLYYELNEILLSESEIQHVSYNVILTYICLAGLVSLLVGLIGVIIDRKKHEKELRDYKQAMDRYPRECHEIDMVEHKKEYHKFKEDYERCKNESNEYYMEYTNAKEQAELLDMQIKSLVRNRQLIRNNLDNFYNYGIIPPDYRTFDCVMMLDQIFRNDLADTMRDAIKIYEERVFRGSVIRGMDKICSMLGQLSSEMSAISLRLDMINSSVTQMGDDLFKANQRLMKNQRELIDESIKNRTATEDLIRETQLGRYTNEKLLESNKRLKYYAEEYRMGRMPRDFMN